MILLIVIFLLFFIIVYFYLYYPQQLMPPGKHIIITTPEYDKYKNDCLHPCIRYIPDGFLGYKWWMVQSPYYERNSKIENPILYFSNDLDSPQNWECVGVVRDTPLKGYNSDPNLFYEDNKLWVFWRECKTSLCDELNVAKVTVGCYTSDGVTYSPVQVYLTQESEYEDKEQCPILIKKGNKYFFYAVHYQYKPIRRSLGIVIWEGNSLERPDFIFKQNCKIKPVFTCDKWKQLKIAGHLFFFPKPLKHNIWHFDLFVFNDKLYMFSVDEWGDNIMMSVSSDSVNFKYNRIPLINSHYTEKFIDSRQYYYKPTGLLMKNNIILYYTSSFSSTVNSNCLFQSTC
jgi:hypothetical protein